jgi:dimeric dUTPase (all-alpha-NTP-PPase superfamily)
MKIQELLDFQKDLDIKFIKGKNITKEQKLTSDLLGLMVEIGELSNELALFKYWKQNKEINWDKVDGEFGDCMCILFSVANQLGYDEHKVDQIYARAYAKNINRIENNY